MQLCAKTDEIEKVRVRVGSILSPSQIFSKCLSLPHFGIRAIKIRWRDAFKAQPCPLYTAPFRNGSDTVSRVYSTPC